MLYQTHVNIAKHILSLFSEHEITYVSRQEFIKGSNHPDIDLGYRLVKHRFEGSIHIVRKLLVELTTEKMSRYERGFKMGIVAHFLSDYMCSYHSNPNYSSTNFASHFRYEQKLHKNSKNVFLFNDSFFVSLDVDGFLTEIATFIMNHMSNIEISMRDDYKMALTIVNHLVKLVLFHVVPKDIAPQTFDTPLRIAIFTDTYYPQINGVSNTLYQYMNYLDQQQVSYVLISPKYKNSMKDQELGYDIIRIKSVSFVLYKETKIAIPKRKKLYQLLDDFKPTVIHVMTEFFIGHSGLSYAKKRSIPVLTNYSTHFVSHLDYFKLGLFKKPLSMYLKWFHNQASMTTCPSQHAKEYLLSLGVLQTSVFGRGIYTDHFSTKHRNDFWRQSFGSNPFIYLYVGRISAEKELFLGLEAFKKIKEKYENVEFVVVGDGPKKNAYIQQYPNVHFLGYKTGQELQMVYASCDIFVFPSPTETLGNVVLEAMASGLPVVVSNQGGVLENVKHMHNGLIAQNQTVEDYYNHMLLYFIDSNCHKTTKNQALEDMKNKQWSKIFTNQLRLYEKLISQRGFL